MASAFSMLFFTLFSDGGPINSMLMQIGFIDTPYKFLSNAGSARGLIALMNCLMWFGNTTILLMAGMMGIDTLSLRHISDKFDMNKSFLSKRFKTATGFGFKEYIINLRIQNACRLLLETNKSITDIAFECGFNDSNYFGDSFRKIKGISPRKYRKNETF